MTIDKVSEFETYLRQNLVDDRFIECENDVYKHVDHLKHIVNKIGLKIGLNINKEACIIYHKNVGVIDCGVVLYFVDDEDNSLYKLLCDELNKMKERDIKYSTLKKWTLEGYDE